MTSTVPRMDWSEMEGGVLGTDWQASDDYLAAANDETKGRLHFIPGIAISHRVKIGVDRIDLSLHLKNISDRAFHDVWSDGGCLSHRTERFYDPRYERSYILTATGLTALNLTHRSVPIRSMYVFHPAWYEDPQIKAYEYFWGRSDTRPTGTLVLSQAVDGRGAIGVAWDYSYSVRQNSDERHRCMHSSPYFGEIQPGQTVTRRGVIWFGDNVQTIERKYRHEKLKPYSGPPEGS
jgi:hypothetical protein